MTIPRPARAPRRQGFAYGLLAMGIILTSIGVGLAVGVGAGLVALGVLIGVVGMFLVDIS